MSDPFVPFCPNEGSQLRRGSACAFPLPHEQEGFLSAALLKLDLLFETDPFFLKLLQGQEQALKDQERLAVAGRAPVRVDKPKRVLDLDHIFDNNPELAPGDFGRSTLRERLAALVPPGTRF